MSIQNDLRAFADWLDEHPAVAAQMTTLHPHITLYRDNADQWPVMLAQLGSFEKGEGYNGQHLTATKQFGSVSLHVEIRKDVAGVCERIQVGERTVERAVYPDHVTPTIEKVVEPVYEWKCPESWMAAS